MKPNFFVIGAAKCGTTSLCNLLSQHPAVFFSPDKEPCFFSHDDNYKRGFTSYEDLFLGATDEQCIGEGSTTYSESWLNRTEKSASRIHDYCPEAKIVYCVRDPIEQIESKWLDISLSIDNGWNNTELIQSEALKFVGDFNLDIERNPDFVNTSNYQRQLLTYHKYFNPKNVEIIFLEDFKANTSLVMKQVCGFLGISSDFIFQNIRTTSNKTADKGLSTRLGKVIRTFPGYDMVAQNSPASLRKIISPFTKKGFLQKPAWDSALKAHIIDNLSADIDSFLKHCNKPNDYWQSFSST